MRCQEKESFGQFINHNRSMEVPFIVYADFECFIVPISGAEPDDGKSFTNQISKHEPCGFCYKIICFDEKLYQQDPVIYRAKSEDEDVAQIFVEKLEEDIRKIHKEFDFAKKMIFTDEDEINFDNATKCWICSGEFGEDKNKRKVRDHCHFNGKYRRAAHSSCNLKFKKPKFTPVVFHNLAGYDCHLFVKNLGKTEGNIKCIPDTDEKYISFSKVIEVDSYIKDEEASTAAAKEVKVMHEIRFIDSFKFMASSLDNTVSNLSKDKLKQTKKVFGEKLICS